jgi:hypothetical protein
MKQKTKRFRGGGLSSDLGSLALIGGLGYMWGRGSKSKDKAAKDAVVENLKPKEEPKKEFTDAERRQAEDYMVGGDPNYKFGDTTTSDKTTSNKTAPVKKSSTGTNTTRDSNATKKSNYVANEDRPSKPYPEKQAAAYPKTKHSNKAPTSAQIDKLYSDQGIKFEPENPLVKKAEEKRNSASSNSNSAPVAEKKAAANTDKSVKKESSGFGPRNTFLTEERLRKSREAMRGGWNKGLFERGSVGHKKGGEVKSYAKGGAVKSSASKRADGIAQRGKTRGRTV